MRRFEQEDRAGWTRRAFLSVAGLAALRPCWAADDPAGPARGARLIVPAPSGGSADRVGRIVAEMLAGILEAPVEVQDIPGDSGVTGMNAVAAAPRDGSVLGLANSTAIIGGKLLSRGARFNPIEDFEWLAILGTYPNAMIVSKRVPARTIDEWLQFARQASPALAYISAGTGSAGHLAGAYLRAEKGAHLTHNTLNNLDDGYKLLDEGFVDVLFDGVPNALSEVPRHDARIVAVTSARRVPGLPDVPCFGELWQRPFEVFIAIVTPRPLARDAYTRLAAAVGVLLVEPAFVARLRAAGLEFLGLSGNGTRAYVEGEFLRNAKLIANLNDEGVRK